MKTILVVDDDADVRALIQVAFTLAGGWTVVTAESLATAIHELGSAAIDVVLTDNQLGDGFAADVRDRASGRPVVVVSASVDAAPSTLVPLPGFAGGISKPFDPLTLPALVASAMDGKRSMTA